MLSHPLIKKLTSILLVVALSIVVFRFSPQIEKPLTQENEPPHQVTSPAGKRVKIPPHFNQISNLPREAVDTVNRILQGGPFVYERDGVIFQNRERRLPIRKKGYYREYTVTTPGSRDRGARRIIRGSGGEMYYTPDHYETFESMKIP